MLSPTVVVLFKNNFLFIPFFDKVKDKAYIIRMCMPETKSRIFFYGGLTLSVKFAPNSNMELFSKAISSVDK